VLLGCVAGSVLLGVCCWEFVDGKVLLGVCF